MIALYIILGVLLLLFLLTLIRVQIFASYSDTLTLTLKILFFKKTLVPSPPEHKKAKKTKKSKKPKKTKKSDQKQKEAEEQPEEKKKKSLLGKLKEKKGLSGLVSLLTGLARIAAGAVKGLLSHVVIHRLDVGVALNSGDAASTAVTYGKLCSVVYPAVNIIVAATVCKSWNVSIEPAFDTEGKTEVTAELHAHLRILFAIHEALKAGVKLLWLRIKL